MVSYVLGKVYKLSQILLAFKVQLKRILETLTLQRHLSHVMHHQLQELNMQLWRNLYMGSVE